LESSPDLINKLRRSLGMGKLTDSDVDKIHLKLGRQLTTKKDSEKLV
jgi:hypothetical protein